MDRMANLMKAGCLALVLAAGFALPGAETPKPADPTAKGVQAEKKLPRKERTKLLDRHLGPVMDGKFRVCAKMERTAETAYRNAKSEGVGEKEASDEARAVMSMVFAEAIPVLEEAAKNLRALKVPAEIEEDRVSQLAEVEKTLKWAKTRQAERSGAQAQAETARLVKLAEERKVRVAAKKARKAKLKKELLEPALAPRVAAFGKIGKVGDRAYDNAKRAGLSEKEAEAEARAVVSALFPALLPAVEETLEKLHAIESVEEIKAEVAKEIKSAEKSVRYMKDQIKLATDEKTAKEVAARRAAAAKRTGTK